jgi:hypothetical protein
MRSAVSRRSASFFWSLSDSLPPAAAEGAEAAEEEDEEVAGAAAADADALGTCGFEGGGEGARLEARGGEGARFEDEEEEEWCECEWLPDELEW